MPCAKERALEVCHEKESPTAAGQDRTTQRYYATVASVQPAGTAIRASLQKDRQPPTTSTNRDAYWAEFKAWTSDTLRRYRARPSIWTLFLIANSTNPPACMWNRGEKPTTMVRMQIAIFGMRLLEVMFFVGLAGRSIVVSDQFCRRCEGTLRRRVTPHRDSTARNSIYSKT